MQTYKKLISKEFIRIFYFQGFFRSVFNLFFNIISIIIVVAPEEAFWLSNSYKCLKLESGSNNLIIGTSCLTSPTLDMLWIWTTTGTNKQLMNVKTLKCMQRQDEWEKVEMKQCKKTSDLQKIQCTKYTNNRNNIRMKIRWSGNRFLHLPRWSPYYAVSVNFWSQSWKSEKTSCETSTAYNGITLCFKLFLKF